MSGSWKRPTSGARSATGPGTSSGWRPSLRRSRVQAASRSPSTRISSTGSRRAAATRSTSASTRRSPASASPPTRSAGRQSALSGGEQTRAALARLVISDPDLLLLDEPTNHLDIGALEWLEEHLRRRSGSLLVASHDRAFLDGTVERIWELRDRRLTTFRGNYSAYHRQRVERDERAAKDATVQTGQIAREKELIQSYRSQRKFSKMHEHEARLERLQADRLEAPKRSKSLRLPHAAGNGPVRAGAARSGQVVARLEDLVVGYAHDGSAVRIARAPWLVAQRGERIGVVGPNGAGKTTLLRTIAGDLPALDGTLSFGQGVQLGYLAQLRAGAIAGTSVLDALLVAMPVTQGEARSYLARFLFRGDDVDKEVRTLSGGERSRLELALLGITQANLLLLDEPTNHLDIPAREAIEAFIREAPATVLVVSHDRRLLEELVERLWVVDNGLAVPFDGGYDAWRAAVADGWTVAKAAEAESKRLRVGAARPAAASAPALARPRAGSTGSAVPIGLNGSNGSARAARPAGTPSARPARAGTVTKLSKEAYRRQKASVEADLTRLGLRRSHLVLAMSDPGVGTNFIELRRISSELADVEQALETAETAWLELEERAP